jgi:hypothetical protein
MRFRSTAAISPGQMAKVTGPWRLMRCASARSRRRVWSLSQLGEPRPKPVACYPWLARDSADQRARLATEASFHLRIKLARFTNRFSSRAVAMSKS